MAKQRRAADPSMRINDFLALVHEGVIAQLGDGLDGMESRRRFGYLQYYRGSPQIHYEVWAQRKTGRLEIGLHFEAERERSYAAANALADRARDVEAAIGREYELEEWTPNWTRLHRSVEAPSLTPDLAIEAAQRVVALVRGMEPMLDDLRLRT